ncbi:hypothetical protein [Chelativorans intermedius]|uniref:hypothetical protein n=1 Tax=Chelativorans intermedius TaxID=515947 RepID=UPI0021BF8C15|nr:hypothetical protein [Chelativorans intermedius]MCT9000057.1 hypothetical protein [Chelativorans intermedius]
MEKGDAQDRAFREKVYRQAFAALERSLEARPGLSAEEVRERRERVKSVIAEIEKEFLPAVVPVEKPAPPREEAPAPEAAGGDFVPHVERDDRLSPAYAAAEDAEEPDAPGAAAGRRRPFALVFVLATLVAAVGMAAWWALQSGILQPQPDGGGSASPPLAQEESFDPEEAQQGTRPRGTIQATGEWITIFTPDDPTTVRAPAGMRAEAVNDGEESFLQIAGEPDTAVSFDVGQGVLEHLAGRRVIFSLTARALEGEETQISMFCNLGALGGCGRSRYVVGSSPEEYLLEAELPDRRPTSGGTISVVPDVEGRGRALEILSLRVAVAE